MPSKPAPSLTIGLQQLGLGLLAFGPHGGGWAWWTTARMEPPDGIALRFQDRREAGRLEVDTIVVVAESSGLTGEMLRAVPIARLEAYVNGPQTAPIVRAHIAYGRRNLDLKRLVDTSTRDTVDLDALDDDDEDASVITTLDGVGLFTRDLPPLDIPTGSKKPDAFYAQVAEQYSTLAALGPRPAATLAALNQVPATTVHRWVREARRRGLLGGGERSSVKRPSRASTGESEDK